MKNDETLDMLNSMPLVEAMWWFIENKSFDESKEASQLFFALRERYRKEVQTD